MHALTVKGLESSFTIVSGPVGKSPLQLGVRNFGYFADIFPARWLTLG